VYESPITEYLLEGGCESHPIVIADHGVEVQSTLGRVSSQFSWENRGISYGGIRQIFTLSLVMNNKERVGKKSTGTRARGLDEFLGMLECFWSVQVLKIEEPGCQA
jgi:hypothetical protein